VRVVEVFESLQGEGPFCCRRALFVRLAGCNLRCPWCDTPYALEPSRGRLVGFEEIVEKAIQHGGLVVVTGGEPLLQRSALTKLVAMLVDAGLMVQVETNGTLPAPAENEPLSKALYVVSPKDFPVPVPGARTHPSWYEAVRKGTAWLKLLVAREEHAAAAARLAEEKKLPRTRVYIMPLTSEDMGQDELLLLHRRVAEWAIRYRLEFSPRMHLLLGLK
jgi:7-carboxy-7-deazaguanine synthase